MTDLVKCQLCGKEGPKDGAHTCKGNPPTPEDVIMPCPFCGPRNSVVECYRDDYGHWRVACGACGVHSGFRPDNDREAVIAGWNIRQDGKLPNGNLTLAGEQLFAGIDDRYVDGYQFAMLITFSTKEELAQAVRDRKVEFTLL